MEKFYFEEPSIERKNQAIDYIEEHLKYKSNINGSGSLDSSYLEYEQWLKKIESYKDENTCPVNKCPGYEYFLIRENDDKIIGMINIRYKLTEYMQKYCGHIGYGIRPTERQKGYNKINLYLGLKKCNEIGLNNVLLTASNDNPGSYKTILSFGGILENEVIDEQDNDVIGRYWIDVKKSLEENKNKFEDSLYDKEVNNGI